MQVPLLGEASPQRRQGKRAEASLIGVTVNLQCAIPGARDQAPPDPSAHNCLCLLLDVGIGHARVL